MSTWAARGPEPRVALSIRNLGSGGAQRQAVERGVRWAASADAVLPTIARELLGRLLQRLLAGRPIDILAFVRITHRLGGFARRLGTFADPLLVAEADGTRYAYGELLAVRRHERGWRAPARDS